MVNDLPESIQKVAILGSKLPTSTVSPTGQYESFSGLDIEDILIWVIEWLCTI